MRCSKCGAASHVEYTYDQPEHFRIRRRRRCHNNHGFVTFEIHAGVFGLLGRHYVEAAVRGINKRVAIYKKHLAIWRAVAVDGLLQKEAAAKFGCADTTVSYVVKKISKELGNEP